MCLLQVMCHHFVKAALIRQFAANIYITGCGVVGTLFPSHMLTHTLIHLILHLEQIPSSLDSQIFPLGDSKYSICVV